MAFPKIKPCSTVAVILLITVSNLAFMGHYAAWRLGSTPHTHVGIDPFAGAVAAWFLVFLGLAGVELFLIIRVLLRGYDASIIVGGAMWLLQLVTIRFTFLMLQGV